MKEKISVETKLLQDLIVYIDQSRQQVATAVNVAMSDLYWYIGTRIKADVLGNEKAEYGKGIIKTISRQLTQQYGKGWSEKQLFHCLRTAETFPDYEVFSAVRRELSWSHIKSIIYLDNPLKREFYIAMCRP